MVLFLCVFHRQWYKDEFMTYCCMSRGFNKLATGSLYIISSLSCLSLHCDNSRLFHHHEPFVEKAIIETPAYGTFEGVVAGCRAEGFVGLRKGCCDFSWLLLLHNCYPIFLLAVNDINCCLRSYCQYQKYP